MAPGPCTQYSYACLVVGRVRVALAYTTASGDVACSVASFGHSWRAHGRAPRPVLGRELLGLGLAPRGTDNSRGRASGPGHASSTCRRGEAIGRGLCNFVLRFILLSILSESFLFDSFKKKKKNLHCVVQKMYLLFPIPYST